VSVAPLGQAVSPRAQREAIAAAVLAEPPPLPAPPPGVVRTFGGEVLHASRSRPVVRWVVTDSSEEGTSRFSVVGKVYGKGGGEQAHALLVRLREAGFTGRYDVPAPLGWVPGRNLLLQGEAPPAILYHGLADLTGSLPDVRRAGAWLARLHAVTDTGLAPLPADFEASKAEEYVSRLSLAHPPLTWQLRDIQRRLLPLLDAAAAGELVPTHGDYQPKNLHLDAERFVVIDFDRAALAPAARDLGHFVGQSLTMAAAAGHASDGPARAWATALIDGYLGAGGAASAVAATPAYVARTFLEVLFYRLVVRPVRDPSFAPAWVDACAGWLERQDTSP
jgi:hypothetical protein